MNGRQIVSGIAKSHRRDGVVAWYVGEGKVKWFSS